MAVASQIVKKIKKLELDLNDDFQYNHMKHTFYHRIRVALQ